MVRKIFASDWHILAGILDGMFALAWMRKLSEGWCINRSAWTFRESFQTKGFCLYSVVLLFPVD